MSISLQKGQNTIISHLLRKVRIGLGWDVRVSHGADFDLDASAFLLGTNGKVRSDADFIFYNQLRSACGSVQHGGDNLTGVGDGDDELLRVDLLRVPESVQKMAFCVSIHDFETRRQNFGMVRNAFIRILDDLTDREIARFDLSEDYSIETALNCGELYRHNGEWKFKAIGEGFRGGLLGLARHYGVSI